VPVGVALVLAGEAGDAPVFQGQGRVEQDLGVAGQPGVAAGRLPADGVALRLCQRREAEVRVGQGLQHLRRHVPFLPGLTTIVPVPGGFVYVSMTLWPPLAATTSARLADSWPRTSVKSML